jgi:hypothetical protein
MRKWFLVAAALVLVGTSAALLLNTRPIGAYQHCTGKSWSVGPRRQARTHCGLPVLRCPKCGHEGCALPNSKYADKMHGGRVCTHGLKNEHQRCRKCGS